MFSRMLFLGLIFICPLYSSLAHSKNMSFRFDYKSGDKKQPYDAFYHSLFKDTRNRELAIALLGASLNEYFSHASIFTSLEAGIKYDLIIQISSEPCEDYKYLKPGGLLVIENLSKKVSETDYIDRLKPVLKQFQDYYFVSIKGRKHKLLVLVKKGADPIFRNKKKMTIITPSMRPENLQKVKISINFDYVDEWIIVYDAGKIPINPRQFNDEKIKEYLHMSPGISGNPQRNYALEQVQNEDTYIYFVDDDNVIHKDFYKLLNIIDDEKIYTFDQKNRIKGNNIALDHIDTAMFLIDFKLCKNERWPLDKYNGDFHFLNACYQKNSDKWVYVNNVLCTYNTLPR